MTRIVVYVEGGGGIETYTVEGWAAEELLRLLEEYAAQGLARRGSLGPRALSM